MAINGGYIAKVELEWASAHPTYMSCLPWYAHILYTYKFLRGVIFEVFAVNWPSAKFSSLKFHRQTLTCMNQRAGYMVILENKIAKMLDL